jgi:hypothetical protein
MLPGNEQGAPASRTMRVGRQLTRVLAWATERLATLASVVSGTERRAAAERGWRLLEEHLSPLQRQQLAKDGAFEVVGGRTGRRYCIRRGSALNVDELDENGLRVCSWCFSPVGDLVAGDVMLAQKLALELFEFEALGVANRSMSLYRPLPLP